jgi:GNAT superfamily N-acetyltransferase
MTKKITIRKADAKDIPAIIVLWKELMDFHKKLDSYFTRSAMGHKRFADYLKKHIHSRNFRVLVATDEEQMVGYCLTKISKYPPVYKKQKYADIFDLAVTKKYRGCGIGTMLIKSVLQWCAKRNISCFEVRYSTKNEMSSGFWSKMGFRPYLKTAFLET